MFKNKKLLAFSIFWGFSCGAFAQGTIEPVGQPSPNGQAVIVLDAPTYTSMNNAPANVVAVQRPVSTSVSLNADDKMALNLLNTSPMGNVPPFIAQDGSIRFTFGGSTPTIVCAPLQVCDLQLQAGEIVNDLRVGDTVRWLVEAAISGTGEHQVMHLIFKPAVAGLNTSMVITTNRRTYHITLKSTNKEYMRSVSFAYPEEINHRILAAQTVQQREEAQYVNNRGQDIRRLDFNYTMSGNASWKPLRVYNDGMKTYIDLPPQALTGEVPVLMGLLDRGGLFSDANYYMLNYRLQENQFIVDAVFDEATLIIGVGRNQTRVIIAKGN